MPGETRFDVIGIGGRPMPVANPRLAAARYGREKRRLSPTNLFDHWAK